MKTKEYITPECIVVSTFETDCDILVESQEFRPESYTEDEEDLGWI